MLAQAAVTSHEVAVARQKRTAEDLWAGRVLRGVDLRFPVRPAYSLGSPATTSERPQIVALCD